MSYCISPTRILEYSPHLYIALLDNMKVEKQSPSSKEEDILSQTQDPLERRRLQNRLSQRNHRRKIRERIAKLQERVIANELRAAAAINGWDQGYTTSAFTPRPHSGFSEHEIGFSSRGASLGPEQSPLFMPPCLPFTSWSNEFNTLQQPRLYTGETSQFGTSADFPVPPIITTPTQLNHSPSPSDVSFGDELRDIASMSMPQSANQPLYYVATEAALPQILQVINTMSPQSKLIVLVPPDSSASSSITPFPSTPYGASTNSSESSMSQRHNLHYLGCLCYPYNTHAGPLQSPRAWNSVATYAQNCPLHRFPSSSLPTGGFSARSL